MPDRLPTRGYFERIRDGLGMMKDAWRKAWHSHPGDWMEESSDVPVGPGSLRFASQIIPLNDPEMDPDSIPKLCETLTEDSVTVQNFMESVKQGKKFVDAAWLFESRFTPRGRMIRETREKYPFKIKRVAGHVAWNREVKRGEAYFQRVQSPRSRRSQEADPFDSGTEPQLFGPFDPNQYTEYAPTYGGPFFKQLYLYDYLKMHAYAFEAWNHNPLAHRIVNGLAQYSLGRRFDWRVDPKADPKKEGIWEDFAERVNLRQRLSKYWARERSIYGEFMLNKANWNSIDPSTVWEIVTNPDDITDVYYYYRSYPTAYQLYTGIKVPGVAGAEMQPSQRYIIEQIPYTQVLHIKKNCVSNEKRGRSDLFPILGWLKRVKDLYNAQVIRAQMQASYIWDVTIDGGPQDVNAYVSQYASMPLPGSTHVHNKAVDRKPMPVAPTGRGASGGDISDSLLAFIATSVGLPKDFFNIIATGGGSRATALVAAEPFTKVVEDEQADWEYLLTKMAEAVFEQAGMKYEAGDIEFIFPSVTKDTTSETVKNIMLGEAQGYISKRTAGTMYGQEMNITTYDFEDEQQRMSEDTQAGLNQTGSPVPPPGRNGMEPGTDGTVATDESPIAGDGKFDLKAQLGNI
jgi:hypothetical protein